MTGAVLHDVARSLMQRLAITHERDTLAATALRLEDQAHALELDDAQHEARAIYALLQAASVGELRRDLPAYRLRLAAIQAAVGPLH